MAGLLRLSAEIGARAIACARKDAAFNPNKITANLKNATLQIAEPLAIGFGERYFSARCRLSSVG
jgi:hypothetical protein